jgi:hypothetical protein
MPRDARSPESSRPTLHWYHPNAERIPLRFFPVPGVECSVKIRRSGAVILEILAEQWQHDADIGALDDACGFVSTADLAREYAKRRGVASPKARTLYRYVWNLHCEMKAASRQLGFDIDVELIVNERGTGYRIADCGLLVLRERLPNMASC